MKVSHLLQVAVAVVALGGVGSASAAQVACGNATLGVRLTVVDPGLVGGYCYAQNGNLQNADIAALGLTQIEKDALPTGTGAGQLQSTGSTSGQWSIDASVWNSWDHIYLGFHFGGGGNTASDNPDSFIVELARPDATGTWALTGTGAQLNGLSNMYLLSKGACVTNCGGGGSNEVPEPASVALVGLGLLGASLARRRVKA